MDIIKETKSVPEYIEYEGSLYKLIEPGLTHVEDIVVRKDYTNLFKDIPSGVSIDSGRNLVIESTKSLYEQHSPCCYTCKNNEIGYCIEKCKKLDLEDSKNTCCTEYRSR